MKTAKTKAPSARVLAIVDLLTKGDPDLLEHWLVSGEHLIEVSKAADRIIALHAVSPKAYAQAMQLIAELEVAHA